jgi:hypothetical protein
MKEALFLSLAILIIALLVLGPRQRPAGKAS